MQQLLDFLVAHKYHAQIRGKSWWCVLTYQEEDKPSRYFKASYEVIFTPEMIKSLEIVSDHQVVVTLIH